MSFAPATLAVGAKLMLEFAVLTAIVIIWLSERAATRRRLDSLEQELRELRELRKPTVPDTPRPAAPPPSPAAPAPDRPQILATPEVVTRSEWLAPTAQPTARRAVHPGPARTQSTALRLWQLISGGNPIVRFGVLILFLGVGFLLRYAAEHSHLTIEDRLIGVAVGAIVLLAAGWYWRSSHRTYAMALMGGGVGVLYLTVFTAYRNYALLSPAGAFVLLAVVGGLSAVLAILLDSMAFAVLGTVGGYLAPVLAATPQGDHVALFSYYALLTLVVAGLAWYRSWRPLNLVAFLFTYGVGTAWGVLRYRAQDFATSEPFLVLFLLMFVFIAVSFARSRASAHSYYVDGTLVFGAPSVSMGLQAGMLHNVPYALAYTALSLSAFYLLLAWTLHRRQASVRLLVESFIALSLAFATLAIPLAVEDRWTGAAWALEGAAILWVGLRQERRLAVLAGIVLQFAAAVAYFHDMHVPDAARTGWVMANDQFVSELLLSIGAMISAARIRHTAPEWFKQPQPLVGGALFLLGLAWWLHAGGTQIMRADLPARWAHDELAFAAVSTIALSVLGGRLRWNAPRLTALVLLPALAVFAFEASHPHPFAFGGWWIWPTAFAAGYWTLYRDESTVASGIRTWLHALGLWLLSGIIADELAWQMRQWLPDGPAWSAAAWGLMPAAILLATTIAGRGQRWPFAREQTAYRQLGPLGLGLFLTVWGLASDILSDGSATPLPYVPLFNPIDLMEGLALVALIRAAASWWQVRASVQSNDVRSMLHLAIALQGFAWLNAILLRYLHHYAGIPYDLDSMAASSLAQTCLTILWTLIALAAMVWANRGARRIAWIAGAILLGIVGLKLFLVDLSRTGTLPRIVSFLGVGLLMLVIGFFSPLPPRAAQDPTE
jgi:uncharacterized membrane protein